MRSKPAVAFLFVVFSSSMPHRAFAQESQEAPSVRLFRTARSTIVHIGLKKAGQRTPFEIQGFLGTGFLVDDRCTFATAKHVVSGPHFDNLVLRFQSSQDPGKSGNTTVRVLYEDSETDLAFLRVDRLNNKPCRSATLTLSALSLQSSLDHLSLLVGEPVLVLGHPQLGRREVEVKDVDVPILRRGIVASAEILWDHGPMLLLDLPGVPGFSGSPVILERTGEAIGVVFGPGPTSRATGFEWATPISQEEYRQAVASQPAQGARAR